MSGETIDLEKTVVSPLRVGTLNVIVSPAVIEISAELTSVCRVPPESTPVLVIP